MNSDDAQPQKPKNFKYIKRSLKNTLNVSYLSRLFGTQSGQNVEQTARSIDDDCEHDQKNRAKTAVETNQAERIEMDERRRWYLNEDELQLMSTAALLELTLDENRKELTRIKTKAVKVPIDDVQYVQLGDAFLMKSAASEERVEMWIGEQLKHDRSNEKALQNMLDAGQLSLQRLNQALAQKIRHKLQPNQ
jgi:hypothetical protein